MTNLPHIDQRPKEAAISLLRMIAYHESRARDAEERNLEESLRYHEASGENAAELLALYEKRWPEEVAVGRLEYAEATAAEAGNHPTGGAAQVTADAEKAVVRPDRGSSHPSLQRRVPFSEPEVADRRRVGRLRSSQTLRSATDTMRVADELLGGSQANRI
jgi:hypothetical protein